MDGVKPPLCVLIRLQVVPESVPLTIFSLHSFKKKSLRDFTEIWYVQQLAVDKSV